ncbi:MAG: hypothetical protein WCO56_29300 [Verrucomicrobiota bacterium]
MDAGSGGSRSAQALGNPPSNSVKYFAVAEVLELWKDRRIRWSKS